MTQEIESVKPAISVILDDGDFVINSVGPIGKLMLQAILPLTASAKKVTIICDSEMKVMKRNPTAENSARVQPVTKAAQEHAQAVVIAKQYAGEPNDIQDQFVNDLNAGRTGEKANGESPTPTPGPSDPVQIPNKRKPQIFQDAAAPLSPELAEAEMERLMQEVAQAEQDAAKVAEDQRFQRQQAVQAAVEPSDVPAEQVAEAAKPRKRERQLATTGKPCGRCGGGGQVMGEAGYTGACPVCLGAGQVKSWDRGLKVR